MDLNKLLTGLVLVLPAWLPPRQDQDRLAISAVRFYRADARQTQVKAFIEIPYTLLQASAESPTAGLTYRVGVRVHDSTGLQLTSQEWNGHAPGLAKKQGVSALEILDFAVAPGRYRLNVEITDSFSGRKFGSELGLEGFSSVPQVSDLLLAPRIRDAGPGDTLPGTGEFRRGNLLVTASAGLLLTPLRSKAYYLIETYADADTAALSLTVSDSTGKKVFSTPPRTVRLAKGGGILSGALDLSGLPQGQYAFTTTINVQGTRLQRSAKFRMANLAETMAKAAAQRTVEQVSDSGYFAYMSQPELDQAVEPLTLIAKSGELSVYGKNLSLPARRKFLTEFWKRRDPTPGTARNEARDQFYQAIAYANKTYREEGRAAAPGWKSDRGRIFARNGVPDDVLRRSQQGNAPPYEVWRYSSSKGRYYIFADRTGFGAYSLIHSNDLQETGLTNWQRILGLDVVQDVGRFLGMDLVRIDPGSQF